MRKPRFTYIGAYHHVMNRALFGFPIFQYPHDKDFFAHLIIKYASLYKIKIFAFAIMDNHYHIILQNTTGKMSDFMRQINSIYALYYRRRYGGRGYVFQDRYKSTLIEGERYLKIAIKYALENPVRAKIVNNIKEYKWSRIIENEITKEIIEKDVNLKIQKTKIGEYLGEEEIDKIIEKHNRRKVIENRPVRRRQDEWKFVSVEEAIKEYEMQKKKKVDPDLSNRKENQKIRQEILIILREKCGLKFSEINRLELFQNLKLSSLSKMYWRAKLK